MMLKKGKYPWYSPENVIPEQSRGVFHSLGNLKALPHFPTNIMEMQQLLASDDVAPKAIATQLRADPVMAAQVLQIAENIRNTRNPANPKIKSLEHAVVYIGFKQLSELIMSAALKTFKVPPSGFDVETFWNESYLIGSIAEYIVQRLQLKLPAEEIFIAGSLSNIGKLVSAFCFPPIATKLVREVSDPTVLSTWRKAESTFSFPDHSILGEIAALLWGFPTTIADAVRHHHDVPDPAKKPRCHTG
ncbi:hypothetical protein E3A20_06910 [Planctomyces bekefii]|uniref:HDOD domain-containing protein n=1 Tax=Planctomyces bekefii TaxID=1653850 RepID=A0A5C6MBK8_9PLAN|nr:hypothetical protein E3A20_06910 [Planctomyces bekefii]